MVISLGRSASPMAPWEIREEVELYAREHGRTATMELVQAPMFTCWIVKLSLRPNDPRLLAYREGRAAEPETEVVWLMDHETGKPYDIQQLGAAGVRQFLERGNTFSGRGEFASVMDAVEKTSQQNEERRAAFEQKMREENRYERRQDRRKYLKIPQVTVGIDITSEGAQ